MIPAGFEEYKRRSFCKDLKCEIQNIMDKKEEGSEEYEKLRDICKTNCIHSTYEFHHWLDDKGFLIVKPQKK